MKGRSEWTPKKREKFCQVLEATGGNVSAACKAVSLARSTAYLHKSQNEEFARDWDDAIEAGTDNLEQEARRRAYEGTEKPVFYQGVECGTIREFSDTLTIFLLKGNRPDKYRERSEVIGSVATYAMSRDEWEAQAAKRLATATKQLKKFDE